MLWRFNIEGLRTHPIIIFCFTFLYAMMESLRIIVSSSCFRLRFWDIAKSREGYGARPLLAGCSPVDSPLFASDVMQRSTPPLLSLWGNWVKWLGWVELRSLAGPYKVRKEPILKKAVLYINCIGILKQHAYFDDSASHLVIIFRKFHLWALPCPVHHLILNHKVYSSPLCFMTKTSEWYCSAETCGR